MAILSALNAAAGAAQQIGMFGPFLNSLGQAINNLLPVQLPAPTDALGAWAKGTLNNIQTEYILKSAGVSMQAEELRRILTDQVDRSSGQGYQGVWRGIIASSAQIASPGELVQMRLQEILTDETYFRRMRYSGFWYQPFAQELLTLALNRIPGPGDLVRFALKDVWNAEAVRRFDYDAEYPPEFDFWMKRQGMTGDSRTSAAIAAGAAPTNWAQAYWRSHWANISPTQAFEMFQRLRPGRIADLQAVFPTLRPFTQEDLLTVLRINDYPLPYRPQLAAIAYHKPRLVDIDRFFIDGAIDDSEAYEMHLDLGYSPRNARLRTNWLKRREAKRATGTDPKKLALLYADLYESGRMSADDAYREMMIALSGYALNRGEVPRDNTQEYQAYRQYGNAIVAALQARDKKREVSRSKKLIAAYRKRYLKGMVNAAELVEDMTRAGFVRDWIDQFLQELNAELASGRLMFSTSQIRRLVIEGILPLETATKYLTNLGWRGPEIQYLLTQLKRDLALEQLKQEERHAQDLSTQEQARIRQAKAAERSRLDVVKRLNRQATPAQLMRYFTRAIITEEDFVRELERRGFDNENVKRQVQQGRIERQKYLDKQRGGSQRSRRGNVVVNPPGQAPAQAPPAGAAPP